MASMSRVTNLEMPSRAERMSRAVKGAWQRYQARRVQRMTVVTLYALDDRALKDIGMDRSEIESVVYGEPSAAEGPSSRRPGWM